MDKKMAQTWEGSLKSIHEIKTEKPLILLTIAATNGALTTSSQWNLQPRLGWVSMGHNL